VTTRTETRARLSGLSLRDYWTDGSVSRLCAVLAEVSGLRVELRDEHGHVLDTDEHGAASERDDPAPEGSTVTSIRVGDTEIGSVIVGPGEPAHGSRELVERVGALLGAVTQEMCADVSLLRLRIKEIEVLYKLNALLVDGGRVSDTLELALRSAIESLDLDAGAIMVLPEGSTGIKREDREDELERSVAIGLSDAWLESPTPLSIGREFDHACLRGEVVAVEDLREDSRVLVSEQVRGEGVVSFIGSGMLFENRPIGVIRLYSKRRRAFTSAERRLILSIGQSAAMGVEQARLLELKARERRTQRALKIAGAVQQRMLPASIPGARGIDCAARFKPSSQISGDFYDLFRVRDKIGILVGDVVGKGVVAGLLMSAVRATLRAYAELSDDLSRVMTRTNDAVCRDTTVSEFVTIWYGVYEPETRELCYVTAGHEPPILLTPGADQSRDDGILAQRLGGAGLVAGVRPGEPYAMERVRLEPGQVLVAFTDGVMDAVDFRGSRFGRERLIEVLREAMSETPGASADAIADRVFWHLRQFSGLQTQADDETVVVVRGV